jgi:hypothetical protein
MRAMYAEYFSQIHELYDLQKMIIKLLAECQTNDFCCNLQYRTTCARRTVQYFILEGPQRFR